MGKSPPTKSSWRESGKVETAAGTELKREIGERRGFKFHEDSINRGSAESETLQIDTWQCSDGKGKSPAAQWGLGGSQATWGEVVPPLEGLLVEAVRPPHNQRSQRTLENNHIHRCWNKDVKGEAWCQMCVVIFHNP